jgi:hypothetical protein
MKKGKWLSANLSAQKYDRSTLITGSVVDASLYPVRDAIVLIDGQVTNSITNSEGKYKVRAKKSAEKICVVSHENGFIEVPINGMSRINFQFECEILLKPDEMNIAKENEMVNNGYGNIKKKHSAMQVIKINGKSFHHIPYQNLNEIIQERVAGVRVIGNDIVINGPDYYFRPVPPLLVLDGVYVNSLAGIPPSSVSSIEVLKNLSTVIYGTRGYDGVIIVTTKTGNM